MSRIIFDNSQHLLSWDETPPWSRCTWFSVSQMKLSASTCWRNSRFFIFHSINLARAGPGEAQCAEVSPRLINSDSRCCRDSKELRGLHYPHCAVLWVLVMIALWQLYQLSHLNTPCHTLTGPLIGWQQLFYLLWLAHSFSSQLPLCSSRCRYIPLGAMFSAALFMCRIQTLNCVYRIEY